MVSSNILDVFQDIKVTIFHSVKNPTFFIISIFSILHDYIWCLATFLRHSTESSSIADYYTVACIAYYYVIKIVL